MKFFSSRTLLLTSLAYFTFSNYPLEAASCSITNTTTYNNSLTTPSNCLVSSTATLVVDNSFTLSTNASAITDATNPIFIQSDSGGPYTISGGGRSVLNTVTSGVFVSIASSLSYNNGTISFKWDTLQFNHSRNWIGSGTGITDITLGTTTLFFSTAGGTIESNFSLTGAATIIVDSGFTVTQTGVVSGSGSLTMTGDGALVLSGINLYTGGTTLSSGSLSIQNTSGLGTGTLTLNDSTILTLGSVAPTNAITLAGSGTITTTGTATLSRVITGSGSLVKSGSGTLVLSGTNLYTGGTTLSGGTLNVQNSSGLGTGTLTFTNGTTLALGSFAPTNRITLVGSDL